MPKNSPNLGLYQKVPSTDGNNTFNIDTMLNQNWDRLDAGAQVLIPYAPDTGAANAYAITLSPAPTALIDGMVVAAKIANTSTGASTLDANGLGADPIVDISGNAMAANSLVAGSTYVFQYSATAGNWAVQQKSLRAIILAGLLVDRPAAGTFCRPYFATDTGIMSYDTGTSWVDSLAMNGVVPYAVDTGTANAYIVTLTPAPTSLTDGMGLAVKIANTSTGASTLNVNALGAKSIIDSYGNAVASGTLVAGIIYSLRYNATTGNFILLGRGGGGDATAADLLSGKTATVNSGPITGTMPNNPDPTATITTQNGQVTIPAGKSPGGTITAVLTNLAAAVIQVGVTVGGILGTFTSDATATAAQILSGAIAYINGVKVTGTMPNKVGSGTVITPGPADIAIGQGYYGGAATDGKVAGVSVPAANVLTGTTIAGTAGTMPDKVNSGTILTPGTADVVVPIGFFGGAAADGKVPGDANFIAANLLLNKTLWGLTGTATGLIASGTTTASSSLLSFTHVDNTTANEYPLLVTGLSFTPAVVFARAIQGGSHLGWIVAVNWDMGQGLYTAPFNIADGYDTSIYQFTLTGNAYFASGSFQIPVQAGGINYDWIAAAAI